MAKMLYRKDSGEILGVHIIGLHAAGACWCCSPNPVLARIP